MSNYLQLRKMEKENKEEEGTISINMDVMIEIFSRLPVKSLLKYKSLAKEFAKIIQSRNFVDSCLSISSNRRLLFYVHYLDRNTLAFFSTPHRSTCSIPQSRHDLTFGGVAGVSVKSPPVRGLILCTFGPNQHVICNPATRQNLSLPQHKYLVGLKRDDMIELVIFGYDPIFDQFKVVSIFGIRSTHQYECWVLTLGQDGNSWRKIQSIIPNHLQPFTCGQSGLCINGIVYFTAYSRTPGYGMLGTTTHVMCFDLNSEKFSLTESNPHLSWFSKLIDFQGKLGFVSRVKDCDIEFSILIKNKEWSSSQIFHLPWAQECSSCYYTISKSVLGICDGEIVFVPPDKLGFAWHLSLEKKTTRKVHFQSPSNRSYGSSLVLCFANHVDTTVTL